MGAALHRDQATAGVWRTQTKIALVGFWGLRSFQMIRHHRDVFILPILVAWVGGHLRLWKTLEIRLDGGVRIVVTVYLPLQLWFILQSLLDLLFPLLVSRSLGHRGDTGKAALVCDWASLTDESLGRLKIFLVSIVLEGAFNAFHVALRRALIPLHLLWHQVLCWRIMTELPVLLSTEWAFWVLPLLLHALSSLGVHLLSQLGDLLLTCHPF